MTNGFKSVARMDELNNIVPCYLNSLPALALITKSLRSRFVQLAQLALPLLVLWHQVPNRLAAVPYYHRLAFQQTQESSGSLDWSAEVLT